ncbi:uncharacterized protein BJ171DRAFT_219900 [Polychytrium aggregatum]|uniref:uncharacterized protein n=1 Tax=Polychytrium aggregatum TaxID=110093 RepID=UPI0022FE4463|nr:uncharacterized protein BJ171DRAFT_219900 [Polychytrium aggregatum]KAI9199293.1 hypothetical protein BJ171DRAFT_219900 [Polychytrium aggregatum]
MRMFPFKDYYKWISYGNVYKHYFPNREFSFTLANDVYIRFQSFKDEADLRNNIISKCPEKIDLGAVYNMKPSDRKLVKPGALQPLEHELVFDIDMTDYDDIRTCCSGADICHKCWSFMTIAIKIIDRALEDDFGFSHRLWVYSGRRGVHCWVCDARARKLTAEQRRSIVSYLEVVKGGDKAGKKVNLRNGHPSLSRAQKVLERHFEQTVLEDMGILDGPNTWTKILDMISNEQIRAELVSKWSNSNKTGYDRWADLVSAIKNPKLKAEPWLEREIMFQFLYPRLDSNVSVGLNHLLKSPFCVHPKTGRVCVPINAAECENFDPAKVPTVDDLIVELTEYQKQRKDEGSADDSRVPDYEKTSLKSYTDYFKTWVKDLGEENLVMLRLKREAEEKTMTF